MEKKGNNKKVSAFDFLRHEYFWTPTTTFYLGTFMGFFLIRKWKNLAYWQVIPFMMIPISMDYFKREFYVGMTPEKGRKELQERRVLVQ